MALETKLNFWHGVGQMGRRVGRNSTLVLRLDVVTSEKVELRSTVGRCGVKFNFLQLGDDGS